MKYTEANKREEGKEQKALCPIEEGLTRDEVYELYLEGRIPYVSKKEEEEEADVPPAQEACAFDLSYAMEYLSTLDFMDRYAARRDEFVWYVLDDREIRRWLTTHRTRDDRSVNLAKLLALAHEINRQFGKGVTTDRELSKRLGAANAEDLRKNISKSRPTKDAGEQLSYYIMCMVRGVSFTSREDKINLSLRA